MSRIRGGNTKPERIVRSMLHRAGYRFTVNGPLNRTLPGKPDVVLPKYRTVVFVHGCFWHLHNGCPAGRLPKSSSTGVNWEEKLGKNVKRDAQNTRQLRNLGWRVLNVWECQVLENPEQVMSRLLGQIGYTIRL